MDWDDGQVEVRESGHGADEVCVVDGLPVVALCLAKRIPERVDGVALEPDEEDLGDIDNDVHRGEDDQTPADFGIYIQNMSAGSLDLIYKGIDELVC